MPRVHMIKTNFTGGEFSPLLEGRVDIDQYANAVSELKNFLIMPHGGITRRGGSHYVDSAKYHTKKSRLISFQYSSVQGYICEFGDKYIRFYMNGYLIKIKTGSELVLNGTFPADLTFWTDKSTGTGTIAWNAGEWMDVNGGASGVGWAQQAIPTVVGKEYRLEFDVGAIPITVRIGSTDGGEEILEDVEAPVGTARAIIFIAESASTYIGFKNATDGASQIDNVTCKEYIPYEIESPYEEDDLPDIKYAQSAEYLYLVHPLVPPQILIRAAHDSWTIEDMNFIDGPYFEEENVPTITPDWAGPSVQKVVNGDFDTDTDWVKGANWTISGGTANKSAGGLNNLSQDTTEASGEIYEVIYTIKSISGGNLTVSIGGVSGTARSAPGTYTDYIVATGTGDLTFVPSSSDVVCSIDDVSTFRMSKLTAGGALWDVDHEGALWRIKQTATWGYCEIKKVVSSTVAYAYVYAAIGSDVAEGWREGSWSPYNGYPTSLCFYEDRAVLAGTDAEPQTFWGSKSGDYTNFTPGAADDDSYYYTLGSGQVDIILWLASAKNLLIGTQGAEYVAKGGADNPITPSNIDVKSEATHGSATLQPLRIGNCILFLQAAGRKIREFTYDWTSDAYTAPDLTLLAEHLTFDGVKDMVYQQEPYSIVWVVTNSGALLSLTYERGQKIVGWGQHPTDGEVESIATILNPDLMEDELWLVIKRTVGGATKRFIERLDQTNYTDCCLSQTFDTPVSEVWGLDHLIGKTVDILGDGAPYPPQVVDAEGHVVLQGTAPASEVECGLHFTSGVLLLRPEIATNAGTTQGIAKHWSKLGVRLFETIGITINGKSIEFRTPDDPMDEGVSVFSGDKWMTNLGRDKDGKVSIEQTQPLPCTIVCVIGVIDFGD